MELTWFVSARFALRSTIPFVCVPETVLLIHAEVKRKFVLPHVS